MNKFIILFIISFSSLCDAGVYKCVIGGTTSYQSSPCKNDAASSEIDLNINQSNDATTQYNSASFNRYAKKSDLENKIIDIRHRINKLRSKSRSLKRELYTKLNKLQVNTYSANSVAVQTKIQILRELYWKEVKTYEKKIGKAIMILKMLNYELHNM